MPTPTALLDLLALPATRPVAVAPGDQEFASLRPVEQDDGGGPESTSRRRPRRPGRRTWWIVGLLVGVLVYFNRPGAEGPAVWQVYGAFAALVVGVIGLLLI